MSAFSDSIHETFGVPLAKHMDGVTATVTATDGTETACTVILVEARDEDREGEHNRELLATCHVHVARADVSDVGIDDTITIGSDEWVVTSVSKEPGYHDCTCQRRRIVEFGAVREGRDE